MALTVPELQATARDVAAQYGIPEALFLKTISVESGWDANAYNPTPTKYGNAAGIAQFVPDTAKRYGISDVYDPVQSLWGAGGYLKDLYGKTGNWTEALQKYGTLSSWGGTLTKAQQSLKELSDSLGAGIVDKLPLSPALEKKLADPSTPEGKFAGSVSNANKTGGVTWENIAGFFERSTVIFVGALVLAAGLFALSKNVK